MKTTKKANSKENILAQIEEIENCFEKIDDLRKKIDDIENEVEQKQNAGLELSNEEVILAFTTYSTFTGLALINSTQTSINILSLKKTLAIIKNCYNKLIKDCSDENIEISKVVQTEISDFVSVNLEDKLEKKLTKLKKELKKMQ